MLLRPFEGDRFLFASIAKLCATYKVETIVETGTQFGATTRAFALLAPEVVTVEIEPIRLTWLPPNVLALHLSSDKAIEMLMPNIHRPALFFLDAHNTRGTILLEELNAISRSKIEDSPIVIHDFQVPNTNFGFDTYEGRALNMEFIASAIQPLLDRGHSVSYNTQTEGASRGVCFLLPKQS